MIYERPALGRLWRVRSPCRGDFEPISLFAFYLLGARRVLDGRQRPCLEPNFANDACSTGLSFKGIFDLPTATGGEERLDTHT